MKPEKYVIAYIDLLGTSERISKDVDNSVFNLIKNIYTQMERAFCEGTMHEENIQMKFFSDNVIIARNIGTEDEKAISFLLNQMIAIAANFQFYCLIHKWPSRGGLTIGDLFIDDTFVWGKGLLRAYELESKIANFPRVVIDPKLYEGIISRYPDNVHLYRMDGGLPIVDYFSLMHDESALDYISDAIKVLKEGSNEKTIGKIEWIKESFNDWCKNTNHKQNIIL